MGEKKSSRSNQSSRKERKAKKRAAENLIPDIPAASEPALSSSVNEEDELLDKKAKITERHENNKRKRNRADEEGAVDEEDSDGKNVDEGKSADRKKRKRSKKSSNKESKVCDEVEKSRESVKRDMNKRDKKELAAKDKEKKKEKGKEHKTNKNLILKGVIIDDEESSLGLDKESTSKKSKKECKAVLKAAAPKPSSDDAGQDKESEARVGKNSKVGTNTAGKEISNGDDTVTTTTNIKEKKTSKTKKEKKMKESQEKPGATTTPPPPSMSDTSPSKTVVVAAAGSTTETLAGEKSYTTGTKSGARFIVFVGNLPYTATTASILSHFSKLKPVAVRHLTKKDKPNQSRGMAFVEFANYDTHKTALKIMHHSIFDDGKSEPRMINVELTAGGGGNTEDRKAKIKSKNERLNEQRIRRIEEEEKVKLKKEEEKAKLSKVPLSETAQSSNESNVHPSRRRMITV